MTATRIKSNCKETKINIILNSKRRWTPVEDQQLKNNVTKYGLNEVKIVEGLKRTILACRMRWYIKYSKNLDKKNKIEIKNKKNYIYYNCLASIWTKDEEKNLIHAIELYGTRDWDVIAKYVNTSRSASGCYNKWGKLKYKYNYIKFNHIQTRNCNKIKNDRSYNNQHEAINLSNITIAFPTNYSPTTTPTVTTVETTNSFEINPKIKNTKDIINNHNNHNLHSVKNNNKKNNTKNNTKNNRKKYSSSIRKTSLAIVENDKKGNITTIYDFLYNMEKITKDHWTINDVSQLIIIMSKIKPEKSHIYVIKEEKNWLDVSDKILKDSDDCHKVWDLIQNLSHDVIGDIMVNYWRRINN